MKARTAVTLSWVLWSSGYYLYYPFYSLVAERVVGEAGLGRLYFFVTVINVFLPLIGALVAERLGVRLAIPISLTLSGIGVAMIPLANSPVTLYLCSVLSFAFFLGLPSYYAVMSKLGEGTISFVWAVSLLPSLVFPTLGGTIVQYFGFVLDFALAGILVVLASLFTFSLDDARERGRLHSPSVIPMLVIVPISVISPFFTPILSSLGLDYQEIGILISVSELLGMFMAFYLRRLGSLGLTISLLVFSMIYFTSVNPWVGVTYGAWEAIIPLSLDYAVNDKTIRGYSVTISSQQVGWLVGYAVDSVLGDPGLLLMISSVVSLTLAVLSIPLTRRALQGRRASS